MNEIERRHFLGAAFLALLAPAPLIPEPKWQPHPRRWKNYTFAYPHPDREAAIEAMRQALARHRMNPPLPQNTLPLIYGIKHQRREEPFEMDWLSFGVNIQEATK